VLAEEVYEELIFDDSRDAQVSLLPMEPDRTASLNSFSKTYSMTGWRVGYASGNSELAQVMAKVEEPQISSVPGPAQKAAEAALLGPGVRSRDARRRSSAA
jgi:aminotransferase